MNKCTLLLFLFLCMFAHGAFSLDVKKLHEYSDAVTFAEAQAAVNQNPQSLEDLYVLGLKCLSLHKDDEAEAAFRRMLEIDLSCIEGQWGVAECMRRKRICDACLRLLDQIMTTHPDFYPAYITAAYISYMRGDFEEAADLTYRVIKFGEGKVDLSNYVRALSLYGGSKGMLAHYGGPLSKVINGRAVFPSLKKAHSLQPDSAAALLGLGGYYLLAPPLIGQDLAKAQEYLLKAVEADPLFADTYVRLAQLYKLKGDEQKYNQYLAKALELDPRNEIALDVKTRTCKFICPSKD